MHLRSSLAPVGLALSMACFASTAPASNGRCQSILVGYAWSAQPVSFALASGHGRQFVAFYDGSGQMVIGQRSIGKSVFSSVKLPANVGWDSHNGIAMALDKNGYIHVSGDMHNSHLKYFRSENPYDASRFKELNRMTGRYESAVTYPRFIKSKSGELYFTYRQGVSGSGAQILDAYDAEKKQWSVVNGGPLIDETGVSSAYVVGPIQNGQGEWYLAWMLRGSADASTNHNVLFAKSADLRHWKGANGRPLDTPLKETKNTLVDIVPPGHGLLNGNLKLGLDGRDRAILAYTKTDDNNDLQIFMARPEKGRWVVHQSTHWKFHWLPFGGGSLENRLVLYTPEAESKRTLRFDFVRDGRGATCNIDERTLRLRDCGKIVSDLPRQLNIPQRKGMLVRFSYSKHRSGSSRYLLKWETMEADRDVKPTHVPPPSRLEMYELVDGNCVGKADD